MRFAWVRPSILNGVTQLWGIWIYQNGPRQGESGAVPGRRQAIAIGHWPVAMATGHGQWPWLLAMAMALHELTLAYLLAGGGFATLLGGAGYPARRASDDRTITLPRGERQDIQFPAMLSTSMITVVAMAMAMAMATAMFMAMAVPMASARGHGHPRC